MRENREREEDGTERWSVSRVCVALFGVSVFLSIDKDGGGRGFRRSKSGFLALCCVF